MSNDREVLRVVWEGQIPVCFQLDAEEVEGLQTPDNFYLMISRLSYLPLVTDKVGWWMESGIIMSLFVYGRIVK